MWFGWWMANLAFAGIDPGLEPADVAAQYRAFATGAGRTGGATELVCRPFAEAVVLCFSHIVGEVRVYFTLADARELTGLEHESAGTPADALACLETVAVAGFRGSYLACTRGDGRDHTPLLFPDALRKRLGGDFVAAAPARGVLLVWVPGDLDFDKAVAVGVRRMFENLPDPVSPLVYRWNGEAWVTWAEARLVVPAVPGEG